LKKFPIGVAKYMIWPETTWLRRATSTHHLWFIPVVFYMLKDCQPLDWTCYFLSLWIVMLLGLIGRWLAPREIILQSVLYLYKVGKTCVYECQFGLVVLEGCTHQDPEQTETCSILGGLPCTYDVMGHCFSYIFHHPSETRANHLIVYRYLQNRIQPRSSLSKIYYCLAFHIRYFNEPIPFAK
jgi:hypothetical protein